MPALDRYYRVLGLPPGALPADVKRAYRDLAQVWHPDRFGDNERLREKADKNLTRINEAYSKLKDVDPGVAPPRRISRLSGTYQAVVDMGDMLRTSIADIARPQARIGNRVLGLDQEHTSSRPAHRGGKRILFVFGFLGMAGIVAWIFLT